ncbi:MAG: AmmeMemoRadiSam system protein A [Phycisphaerales bacterium]|nr:AmmeMemoRadiSam system protein A [Phycisphaerales bacterium]MCB9854325.1 AmmeMemoRadiSam system protein A [Phycisphaerales bacterium]MCB9863526.1 AmmeMemoRadiSam system protein A [Phycisphaerales bacterium]
MSVIDQQTGRRLLEIAREAISTALRGIAEHDTEASMLGLQHNGVFVTLRNSGELRGCIGTFSEKGELVDVVRKMAKASLGDPRFADMPVSASELGDIRIELSVLSPLEKIAHATEFDYGRHGVYLKCGHATGCFLPDVGLDFGWDKETFLRHLCSNKMGMAPDSWRSPTIEAWRFEVAKFVEE